MMGAGGMVGGGGMMGGGRTVGGGMYGDVVANKQQPLNVDPVSANTGDSVAALAGTKDVVNKE